ncbi:hypothetical protein ACFLZT_05785 [Thermodesulfobacteriota bacterium]
MKSNLKQVRLMFFLLLITFLCVLISCGGSKEEEPEGPQVKVNTPPTVTIDSPMPFTTYTQGDVISLSCTAKDAEDGPLSGDSLVWVSNIDNQFGTGSSVSKELSAGLHNITVTATDSNGGMTTEEITIIISSSIDGG